MENLIKVFITNLGKYNEGKLIGEWLALPCKTEDIDETLKRISIGEKYEEYFITDYESDIFKIGEYENIYALNETLQEIVEVCEKEYYNEKLLIALSEVETSNPQTMLTYLNSGEIYFHEGQTMEDVGHEYITSCYQIPNELLDYFDFEKYVESWDNTYDTSVGVIEIN